ISTKPRNNAQNAITRANAATDSSGRAKMKIPTARDNKPRSISAHHVNRYMRFTSSIIGLVILPPVWGTHQASSVASSGNVHPCPDTATHFDLEHRRAAYAAPRLTVYGIKRSLFRCANELAIANWSALPEGEFVDAQVADFPLERLARNAELRGRAARAGNASLRLSERGFDQRLLTVGQGGHGCAVRRLALLAREPRVIDHQRLALTLTQHDGTLDHVLQLAYVARPVVSREPLHGLLLDIADGLPRLLGEAVNQVLDQDRNVVGAFAQRRQPNGEHVQPVEQI